MGHYCGDRKANRVLHMIAVVRLRCDARTIDYMQRRLAEGLSRKDVLRCLKRVTTREAFHVLRTDVFQTPRKELRNVGQSYIGLTQMCL